MDELKIQTKKLLSSLIISSAKGLTVRDLQRDYYEQIGEDVPYRKLGYNSIEHFLYSIPETCRLDGSGSFAMVHPVVTEKNKHINDLIMKQKAPKQNKYSRYKPPRRSRGLQMYSGYNTRMQPPPPRSTSTNSWCPNVRLPPNPASAKLKVPPPPEYYMEMRQERRRSPNRPRYNPPRMQSMRNANIPSLFNTIIPKPSESPRPSDNPTPPHSLNPNPVPTTSNNNTASRHDAPNAHRNDINDCDNIERIVKYTNDDDDSDTPDDCYDELAFGDDDYFVYYSEEEKKKGKSDDNDSECDDEWEPNTEAVRRAENGLDCPAESSASLFTDAVQEINEVEEVAKVHESRLHKKVIQNLRTLIAEHPDGICCAKLLKQYQKRFNQTLEPAEYGFASVLELCNDVPDVFHCIRLGRHDWKVYDVQKPIPESKYELSDYLQSLSLNTIERSNTEPPLPEGYKLERTEFCYPDEVMKPTESIPRQWIPDSVKIDQWIPVSVSEVYDPSKFYIHLEGSCTDKLNALMDEMQVFYKTDSSLYALNHFNVTEGLYCAALFMGEYHRAIILRKYDDGTLRVYYIDYGTVSTVLMANSRLLSKEFSSLPQQAIRARLQNILPVQPNTMWPREAAAFMLNLVREKKLFAHIGAIDVKDQVLSVSLTNTDSEPGREIHINDEMVDEGHAVFGIEAKWSPESTALIPNVHLYPAFDEIENGIYPCPGDLVYLFKAGMTFEQIYLGYFRLPTSSTPDFNISYPTSCSAMSNLINNETQTYDSDMVLESTIDSIEIQENCEIEQVEVEIQTEIEPEVVKVEPEVVDVVEAVKEPEIVESVKLEEVKLEDVTKTSGFWELPESKPAKKPPPGFENVKPKKYNGNFYTQNTPQFPPVYNNFMYPPTPYVNSYAIPRFPPQYPYQPGPYPNQSTGNQYNQYININNQYGHVNPYCQNQFQYNNMMHPYQQNPHQYNNMMHQIHQFNQMVDSQKLENYLRHGSTDEYNSPETNTEQQFTNIKIERPECKQPDIETTTVSQNTTEILSTTSEIRPVSKTTSEIPINSEITTKTRTVKQIVTEDRLPTPKEDNKNNESKRVNLEDFFQSIINNNSLRDDDCSDVTVSSTKEVCENVFVNSPLQSEHVCEKLVLKIKIKNKSLHILKINEELYVITQEIISNLLGSKHSFKKWLTMNQLDTHCFPNKLINLLLYDDLYNQIKKCSIPGLYEPTNLGLNVRCTIVDDIPTIVTKYGNTDILSDLEQKMEIIKDANSWRVLNYSGSTD